MSFLCHVIPVDARKVKARVFKIMTIFAIFRLSSNKVYKDASLMALNRTKYTLQSIHFGAFLFFDEQFSRSKNTYL